MNRESFERAMTSSEPNISHRFYVYKCRNAAKNSSSEMRACISCTVSPPVNVAIYIYCMYGRMKLVVENTIGM